MVNEKLYQHSMLVIQIALLITLSWVDCVPVNKYNHNKLPDRKYNPNVNRWQRDAQSQPHHPNQYDANAFRRETHFMSKEPWIVDPHQPTDNRIFRERNHQHERNRFRQPPFEATQIKRQQQRQQEARPIYVAKDFPPVQMRDATKNAGIVDRNSTFLIEYDVSDKDVTYETIMEVEDTN